MSDNFEYYRYRCDKNGDGEYFPWDDGDELSPVGEIQESIFDKLFQCQNQVTEVVIPKLNLNPDTHNQTSLETEFSNLDLDNPDSIRKNRRSRSEYVQYEGKKDKSPTKQEETSELIKSIVSPRILEQENEQNSSSSTPHTSSTGTSNRETVSGIKIEKNLPFSISTSTAYTYPLNPDKELVFTPRMEKTLKTNSKQAQLELEQKKLLMQQLKEQLEEEEGLTPESLEDWKTLIPALKGLQEGKRLCILKEDKTLGVKEMPKHITEGGTSKEAVSTFLTLFGNLSMIAKSPREIKIIDDAIDELTNNTWLIDTADKSTLSTQLQTAIRLRLAKEANSLFNYKDIEGEEENNKAFYTSVLQTFKKYEDNFYEFVSKTKTLRLNLISKLIDMKKAPYLNKASTVFETLLQNNGLLFDNMNPESLLTNSKMLEQAKIYCGKSALEVFEFIDFLIQGASLQTDEEFNKHYGKLIYSAENPKPLQEVGFNGVALNMDPKYNKQFSEEAQKFCTLTLLDKLCDVQRLNASLVVKALSESGTSQKLMLGFNSGQNV